MQIVGSNRYRWPLHDVIPYEYDDTLSHSKARARDQKTRAFQDRCLNVQAAGTCVTPGGSVALCCVKLCYSFNKNNLNIISASRVYQLKNISLNQHSYYYINTVTSISYINNTNLANYNNNAHNRKQSRYLY